MAVLVGLDIFTLASQKSRCFSDVKLGTLSLANASVHCNNYIVLFFFFFMTLSPRNLLVRKFCPEYIALDFLSC